MTFIQSNRDQAYLLPPDMKGWLPDGDLAHLMVAAVDRVWLGPFDVAERAGGKPQYRQPLLMPEAIASRLAAKSDWTVRALASDLQAEAVVVPHDMVWRFLRHQGFSIKKRCSRAMCRIYQPRLDPTRLVFIDETWVKTNMTRTRGWSPRGTPLIARFRMAIGRR